MKGAAVIRKHTRRAAKAAFAISFGVAILLGLLAGTARPAARAEAPKVVMGTKDFPEEYILGELYRQALQAKGFKVDFKGSLGSTELIHTAITSGKINFYPEYTGVIVQVVHHRKQSPATASKTFSLAKALEVRNGLTLLDATPFYDTDVIAVTKATARKYGLKTVGDLRKAGSFKFGGAPECKTRTTCFLGLTNTYGVKNATFVSVGGISPYAALDAGKVLAADVFSTDPPLGKGSKYKVLADPKHIGGFQNVAPVVKTSVLKQLGDNFKLTVNAVSAKLTQPAIVAMNKAVIVDKKSPASVAKAFLKANGLV